MSTKYQPAKATGWELAAEAIAVKIRCFGLLIGYLLANLAAVGNANRPLLNGILTLGGVYVLLDTLYSVRGRVFMGRYPLLISAMEALFIGLLCYYGGGLDSLFRYYYFLSLICCAIRHSSRVTYATCALHCISYTVLYLALPPGQRSVAVLVPTLVVLGWLTWAGDAMAVLLKRIGDHLGVLNTALRENQALLESRIQERTDQLRQAQAHVLHQEKMAAFGLLAAGIAHEVGNPLTSISAMVQILQRRDTDGYTIEKLRLIDGQLQRIQTTLRELIDFSRPASTERTWFSAREMVAEARNIAKYYKRTKGRIIQCLVPPDLPPIHGVRDQFVQVFLNLILNAIDATDNGGRIEISASYKEAAMEFTVRDDGTGMSPEHVAQAFQPYFTTKPDGTGLGLFVTQRLIAGHGGSIEMDSAPGQGTAFHITVPMAVSHPVLQWEHPGHCPAAGNKEVTWRPA
jgi:signal transduction histidine kinase